MLAFLTEEQAVKAIKDPKAIPRYVIPRLRGMVINLISPLWLRGLPSQLDKLDALRSEDEYLLVILDACRYDYFAEVAPRVLKGDLSMLRTEGHNTFDWGRLCWSGNYPETTYISGAPIINSTFEDSENREMRDLYRGYRPKEHIREIVDVWDFGWDADLKTTPPTEVTDSATSRLSESRLVAHYYQPHAPFVGAERLQPGDVSDLEFSGTDRPSEKDVWESARWGDLSLDRLRELYRANLEWGLAEALRLIEDASHSNVVVTADHGEALGEWGSYAHPRVDHPMIRKVPWFKVDSVKPGWREKLRVPERDPTKRGVDNSVESRLEDLGYIG